MNSLTLRSAFYPLIGERIYGLIGASVDVCVICTTCGISVGLCVLLQINTGFNYLFGLPTMSGCRKPDFRHDGAGHDLRCPRSGHGHQTPV